MKDLSRLGISWIDKIAFWNKEIITKEAINSELDLFVVKSKTANELHLKFKHRGNTQFHKVTVEDLQRAIDVYRSQCGSNEN